MLSCVPVSSAEPDLPKGMEVIFSLQDGEVWISFEGYPVPIRIGGQDEVTAAMRDFIAQGEVATRLLGGRQS